MTSPSTTGIADHSPGWQVANVIFLLACVSMYFGTGWSLVLFSFPIAPKLTTATYYLQFVPQVQAATAFLTPMTIAMMVSAVVMIWTEWKTGFRWVPIVVLAAVIIATVLTEKVIFPLNVEMAAGITDQSRLTGILDRWMSFNRIRVWLWTLEWVTMAAYVFMKTARAPRLREAAP
jgi:chromate transport protein ChrA